MSERLELRVALTFDAEHPHRPWCPQGHVERILDAPHEAKLREDVLDGQEVIERATGKDPRPWLRCPFGAGSDDPRVPDLLGELGYRNVHWDLEIEALP